MERDLRHFSEAVTELLYPTATYCIVCGNYIDKSRSYCICDHCIRHIGWGNIRVDVKRQAEAERRSTDKETQGVLTDVYKDESPLEVLQAAYRQEAWELPDSVSACFEYGLYSRRVVFELKYNGHSYVARVGAQIMADRVRTDTAAAALLSCDFVAAVPVSRKKLQTRGFNQAEKLAKYFCRETGMVHFPDILMRAKDTEALRSLSPAERSLNLEDAFCLNERKVKTLQSYRMKNEKIERKNSCDGMPCESGDSVAGQSVNYTIERIEAKSERQNRSEENGVAPRPLEGMRVLLIDDIYTTGATAKHCTKVLKAAGASEVHMLVLATGSDFAVNAEPNIP